MNIPGDNPIRDSSDDVLSRASVAESFARQVLALDVSEGVVVGVLGPWGSGKTSFVNLAREHLVTRAHILDFNPWMFSGAEQLVESFFVELSAQLKLRSGLEQIGEDLAEYGESFSGLAWFPVVGPWIERGRGAAKLVGKLLQRRREGTAGRRKKLEDALSKLEHPLVVILDDIDRLTTSEIRDVFKLVRLTASFPNVIYVVAFDRVRVENALGEQGVPGRDYLEKILQVAIDLPVISNDVINRQVFSAIDGALADVQNLGELDQEAWPDVYMEIIRPLIRNMRDIRRYAVAVRGTVDSLDGQIALSDVLGLEAIRVFLPDTFAAIQTSVEALTTPSSAVIGGTGEPTHLKESIDDLTSIEDEKEHQEVVRNLIPRLFPFAQRHIGGSSYGPDFLARFLREHRVAHEANLRLYLERVAGEQLTSFRDAERAWSTMGDRAKFSAYLRSLEPERLEDVIAALENYEEDFAPELVVPGVIGRWTVFPDIPDRPRGMFDFDKRLVVGRVTYRLLRSLPDKAAVEKAVEEIVPELETLSAKWQVIGDVGYREGAGHKLVSEDAAKRLEKDWRAEVRAASAEDLEKEHDLLRVLLVAKEYADDDEPGLSVPDDPNVTLVLLKSARSEVRGQTMGTRAVRRSARLAWDVLVKVYGDEDTLKARIEALPASSVEIEDDLGELVNQYASGWRPDDRFEGQ